MGFKVDVLTTGKREKARWDLHKDTACYLEQTLEVAPNKTAVVQSFLSHLANPPSKISETCRSLLGN